jgi:hypothetical protein
VSQRELEWSKLTRRQTIGRERRGAASLSTRRAARANRVSLTLDASIAQRLTPCSLPGRRFAVPFYMSRNDELPNTLMERLGSGIRFMLDETKRLGLPGPQFREMNEFVVSFSKAPALMSPQQHPQYAGTLWEEQEVVVQHEILSQNQSDQRERRLTQAVEYVQKYGFITNSIYRQLTGVSDRTAHRDLETLIERGRLKGTGQKAARRYVLA